MCNHALTYCEFAGSNWVPIDRHLSQNEFCPALYIQNDKAFPMLYRSEHDHLQRSFLGKKFDFGRQPGAFIHLKVTICDADSLSAKVFIQMIV